jgi:hypothetical protein
MDFDIEAIQFEFPFISGLVFRGIEYYGIIQNADDKIVSFYDFQAVRTDADKSKFLELGETWWWESNRMLPINIFLRGEMQMFQYCLKTVIQKDTEILFGPVTSLDNIYKRRIKRRQIQLIRKTD